MCVWNAQPGGPHSFAATSREPREKAPLRQAFSEEDVTSTELNPGPEHSGRGWRNLENNPAKCPVRQEDSNNSDSVLKSSMVGCPPPPQ